MAATPGQIHGLWGHLPLLVRANSKDSVEYILQALWRTREKGLDSADREIFRQVLQLQSDAELDPLLVCLRILIRRCVYETADREDIQKLFPPQVLPELQRLLTLLFQKFHREWREDVLKECPQDQGVPPPDPAKTNASKPKLSKDTLETMLQSMYQVSGTVDANSSGTNIGDQ